MSNPILDPGHVRQPNRLQVDVLGPRVNVARPSAPATGDAVMDPGDVGTNRFGGPNTGQQLVDAFSQLKQVGTSLASDTFSTMKNAIPLDLGIAEQLGLGGEATAGAGSESMGDFFKNMTPGKFVGLQALSTGLQTAGALASISSQERQALDTMQKEYNLQLDQIEYQEWMGDHLRQIADTQQVVADVKAMQAQGAGPVQQQVFARDPRTGALI